MAKKILQIIPAPGWRVVYGEKEGERLTAPLACWALIEDEEGHIVVEGMDADDYVDFVEGIGNFSRYEHESEARREASDNQSISGQ